LRLLQRSITKLEGENDRLKRDKRALMDEITEIKQRAHNEAIEAEAHLKRRISTLEANAAVSQHDVAQLRERASQDALTIRELQALRASLEATVQHVWHLSQSSSPPPPPLLFCTA
jgi:predicted RNase H-like nuclease (RuvC/YqgF family)